MSLIELLFATLTCFAFGALVVPDVGEVELLDKMLKDALSVDESMTLQLYSAVSPAISENSVAGDFTACTFTGYVTKTITRASWAGAATAGGVTSTTSTQLSWSPTSPQTVLGYWLVGATSAVLLWAEAFGSSRSVQNGDTLQLTPRMELA
jgi:hypothetical protein